MAADTTTLTQAHGAVNLLGLCRATLGPTDQSFEELGVGILETETLIFGPLEESRGCRLELALKLFGPLTQWSLQNLTASGLS